MGNVASAKRDDCFSTQRQVCGNGYVETGEECDCGTKCAETKCCNEECKVPEGIECSPQNVLANPCCTQECTFVTAAANFQCFDESSCEYPAYCNGLNSSCPEPADKPNSTVCGCQNSDCGAYPNTFTKYCDAGTCNVSVCERFDGEQCELAMPNSCILACQGQSWGTGFECVSSFDTAKLPAGFPADRLLLAGSPCNNYQVRFVVPESSEILPVLNPAPRPIPTRELLAHHLEHGGAHIVLEDRVSYTFKLSLVVVRHGVVISLHVAGVLRRGRGMHHGQFR